MEIKKTFACAINCMDGRIQDAVKNYLKQHHGVDFVDMVTEPGTNKILAENTNTQVIENIKKRVGISVEHHGAKTIAIVGHFSCAGNPVEKKQQSEHLKQAIKTVEAFGFDMEIVPLWVDGDWTTVEKVV